MTFQATNTADKILVVEGQTDLPPGSPLQATLSSDDGQELLRDHSVVRGGKFYFDFDVSQINGLDLYEVRVTFDPTTAPLGARSVTGIFGEALQGSGVVSGENGRVLRRRVEVTLTTDGTWQDRNFDALSERELQRVTKDLEKLLEERSEDRRVKLALARAYIAAEPREMASGSRAHALLKDAAVAPEPDKTSGKAEKLLKELESKEAVLQAARAKRTAAVKGAKYFKNTEIKPGLSLGGFNLGTPYNAIRRHFTLASPANFDDSPGDVTITLKELPGVELTFGKKSRRLVAARTTSPKFALPEGFKVGSLLQELQNEYGRSVVPTPEWSAPVEKPDGKTYHRGTVLTNGLEFEILKVVDPVFGIPVDKVEAISVFKPGYKRR